MICGLSFVYTSVILKYPKKKVELESSTSLLGDSINYLIMGAEGLEPTRPFKVNGFSFSRSFRYCLLS